jgi:hypothetical protein
MCTADLKGEKEDVAGSERSSRMGLPLLGMLNMVEKYLSLPMCVNKKECCMCVHRRMTSNTIFLDIGSEAPWM